MTESGFQAYLDGALQRVQFTSEVEPKQREEYDVFEEVRAQIAETREKMGMTQGELAEKAGTTQANISNIESGNNRPTITTLKRIADVLDKRLVVEMRD